MTLTLGPNNTQHDSQFGTRITIKIGYVPLDPVRSPASACYLNMESPLQDILQRREVTFCFYMDILGSLGIYKRIRHPLAGAYFYSECRNGHNGSLQASTDRGSHLDPVLDCHYLRTTIWRPVANGVAERLQSQFSASLETSNKSNLTPTHVIFGSRSTFKRDIRTSTVEFVNGITSVTRGIFPSKNGGQR